MAVWTHGGTLLNSVRHFRDSDGSQSPGPGMSQPNNPEQKPISTSLALPIGKEPPAVQAIRTGLMTQHEKMMEAVNYTFSQFSNWDSPNNLISDVYGFGSSVVPPLYYDNRNRGELVSVYLTWEQLKIIRDQNRQLCASNEFAVSGLENRVNYVVGGDGLNYKVVPIDPDNKRAAELAKEAQHIIDATIEINRSTELEQACMRSLDENGEFFVRIFARDDGFSDLRFVEPEHIRPPAGEGWPPETSFGVKTDRNDVCRRIAYHQLSDPLTDQTTGEWVPAREMVHMTLNVGTNVKRGLPTYYQVIPNLRRCEDLLASMSSMAKARAKIALIRKVSGLTNANAEALISKLTGATINDPTNNENITIEKLRYGTILTTNGNTEYEAPGMNLGASDLVDVLQAELRAVATRLQMPEWMFTAVANATYSNAFVGEGPVLKAFQKLQRKFVRYFGEYKRGSNCSVYWKVLKNAIRAGIIDEDVYHLCKIDCTGPTLEARDKKSEADTNQTYLKLKSKSRSTVMAEQSLGDDERRKIEQETNIPYLDEQTLQQIQTVSTAVYSGQLPHEAGIAQLTVGMGIPDDKARKLLPVPPPPPQQPAAVGIPGAPGAAPGGVQSMPAGQMPQDQVQAGDPNAMPADAAVGAGNAAAATTGGGELSAPVGSQGGQDQGQQDIPDEHQLEQQFDGAMAGKTQERQASDAVVGTSLSMLGIPPEEQEEQPNDEQGSTPVTESATVDIPVGCVMVRLGVEDAEYVKSLAQKVHFQDLIQDGRETVPHVTVRYGLLDADADEVRLMLDDCNLYPFTLSGKLSAFLGSDTGKEYDVLYVPVKSAGGLHDAHEELGDCHNIETYPGYTPHVTLAYVKAGTAQKYIDSISAENRVVDKGELVYADPDGITTVITTDGECVTESMPLEIGQLVECSAPIYVIEEWLVEQGFTGQVKDALGRVYQFVNGIRQKGNHTVAAPQQPAQQSSQYTKLPTLMPKQGTPSWKERWDLAAHLQNTGKLDPTDQHFRPELGTAGYAQQQPEPPAQPVVINPASTPYKVGKAAVAAGKIGYELSKQPFKAVAGLVDLFTRGKADDWAEKKIGQVTPAGVKSAYDKLEKAGEKADQWGQEQIRSNVPKGVVATLAGTVQSIFGGNDQAIKKFVDIPPSINVKAVDTSPKAASNHSVQDSKNADKASNWAEKAAKWHAATVARKLNISKDDAERKLYSLFGTMAKMMYDQHSAGKSSVVHGNLKGVGKFTLKKGTGKTGDPTRDFMRSQTGLIESIDQQIEVDETHETLMERGFTGRVVGKDNRVYYYMDGMRVKTPGRDIKGQPISRDALEAEHAQLRQQKQVAMGHLSNLLSGHMPVSRAELAQLNSAMSSFTVPELGRVAKAFNTSVKKLRKPELMDTLGALYPIPSLSMADPGEIAAASAAKLQLNQQSSQTAQPPEVDRSEAISQASFELSVAKRRILNGVIRGDDAKKAISAALQGLSPDEANAVAKSAGMTNRGGSEGMADRMSEALLGVRGKSVDEAKVQAEKLAKWHKDASKWSLTAHRKTEKEREVYAAERESLGKRMAEHLDKFPELSDEFGKYASSEPSAGPIPTAEEHLAKYKAGDDPAQVLKDFEDAGGTASELYGHIYPTRHYTDVWGQDRSYKWAKHAKFNYEKEVIPAISAALAGPITSRPHDGIVAFNDAERAADEKQNRRENELYLARNTLTGPGSSKSLPTEQADKNEAELRAKWAKEDADETAKPIDVGTAVDMPKKSEFESPEPVKKAEGDKKQMSLFGDEEPVVKAQKLADSYGDRLDQAKSELEAGGDGETTKAKAKEVKRLTKLKSAADKDLKKKKSNVVTDPEKVAELDAEAKRRDQDFENLKPENVRRSREQEAEGQYRENVKDPEWVAAEKERRNAEFNQQMQNRRPNDENNSADRGMHEDWMKQLDADHEAAMQEKNQSSDQQHVRDGQYVSKNGNRFHTQAMAERDGGLASVDTGTESTQNATGEESQSLSGKGLASSSGGDTINTSNQQGEANETERYADRDGRSRLENQGQESDRGGLPEEKSVGTDADSASGRVLSGSSEGTEPDRGSGSVLDRADEQRDKRMLGDGGAGDSASVSPRISPAVVTADPAGRDRPARGVGAGSGAVRPDGRNDAVINQSKAEESLAKPSTPENPTGAGAGNFKYTDDHFVAAGLKAKYKANVAAIRTMQAIEAEGRDHATPEEQQIMSRCVGWGQFPGLFNYADNDWYDERRALQNLLTSEEWDAARKSTLNGHYTSPDIVRTHWKIAQHLGFNGGRYLEPSAGVGYYLGMMPEELAGKTRATAVELDLTTGGILKHLYPDHNVHVQGFEKLQKPDNFYDLVASNVPFGNFKLHDPRYNKFGANIHDYFFLKSGDLTRPGGLVMHITSTGTMDKPDSKIRAELAKNFDLVGALRFPGDAHKANAGTSVVTDMLILRKRHPGEESNGTGWMNVKTVPDPAGGEPIPVNEYFVNNPHHILGTLDRTGSMYHEESVNVSKTPDYEERLQKAIESLPQGIVGQRAIPDDKFAKQEAPEVAGEKNGAFSVRNGKLYVRNGGEMVEQEGASKATIEKISDHQNVLNAFNDLISAQKNDGDTRAARLRLNAAYDRFVSKHGFLHDRANRQAFRTDPDAPVLLSLENYNSETKKATKSDIFHKDTIRKVARVEKVNNPTEGLGVSLHETGGVDIKRIAQLTGMSTDDVEHHLSSNGLAFHDPSSGWHAADRYLSGNVRKKLAMAKAAAQIDPKFHVNVAALEKVQPEDIDHADIGVKLGAPWVPSSDVAQFSAELLGASPDHFRVNYIPSSGTWHANFSNEGNRRTARGKEANEIYGTPDKDYAQLLEAGLNNVPVMIYRKESDGTSYLDKEATDAANAKIQDIKDKFADWVWTDDERRDRLHRHYNDNFNNTIPFKANGSHLSFPGMHPDVNLRPHQKDFVWHTITTGTGLAAHEVGTGKTYTMIASAMELRRLGLAKKPAIACLKANIEAITADARKLYPGAKILSTQDVKSADERNKIMSQIATGDYDMVVMTHDHLDMMKMKPETMQKYIEEEIAELEAAKEASLADNPKKDNRVVKALEKAKANLEAKLQEALDENKKDNAMAFEDSGIDHLFVDEAHKYKSLPCYTKQNRLKGVPTSRSDRATNMLMRTRWLMENNGGRGVTFATGTPVANTMAELYNMQRYLQPNEMRERGVHAFDAWSNVFGDVQTKMEHTVSGEYKSVSRFAKFVNIPELMQSVRQIMDVQRADKMTKDDGSPVIVRPKRKDNVVVAPQTPAVTALMESLKKRANELKSNKDSKDNMLVICTDGRKGALDMRLLDATAEDDPQSKTNQAINNVLRIHKERPGVTQMIFSDIGVNPTDQGFSLYGDMIDKLVKGGIPREKIADFSKLEGAKKDAAVQAMKEGKVLVAIGSTDKLGTGVNAQDRLYALHHLDVPWLPASVEQRDGRGWRQGNMNDPTKSAKDQKVEIHRYVTEGSLDKVFWQTIGNKTRFIKQVMNQDPKSTMNRVAKDEDTEELSPEQLMAAASGDPRIMEKVQLDDDVKNLTNAKKRHENDQYKFKDSMARSEREIPRMEQHLTKLKKDAALVESNPEFKLQLTNGKVYTDRKEAAEALEMARANTKDPYGNGVRLGTYKGLHVYKNGERMELRSDHGGEYSTGDSLASVEHVARNIGKNATAYETEINRKRNEIENLKSQIGKPFGKQNELDEKLARTKTIEDELQGKFLPYGYKEGDSVELADGRHVKIVRPDYDHQIVVDHNGDHVNVHHDMLPKIEKPKEDGDNGDEPDYGDDEGPSGGGGGGGGGTPPESPSAPSQAQITKAPSAKPSSNLFDDNPSSQGSPTPVASPVKAEAASGIDDLPTFSPELPSGSFYKFKTKDGDKVAIRGESQNGSGDSLHISIDDANKELDFRKRQKESREALAKQAEESNRREQAERDAEQDTDGFADSLPAMQKGRVIKTLNTLIRSGDGKVRSRKEHIRDAVNRGVLSIEKLKDGTETLARSDGRIPKAGGGFTENEHYWWDLGSKKTEVEYAKHLLAKKNGGDGKSIDPATAVSSAVEPSPGEADALEAKGLYREFGGKHQYRPHNDARWLTANSKEEAIQNAKELGGKTDGDASALGSQPNSQPVEGDSFTKNDAVADDPSTAKLQLKNSDSKSDSESVSNPDHDAETQAKLNDLRSKIDEYRKKVANKEGSKSDQAVNRDYLFRLEQEHDDIAGVGASGRTLADNERDTKWAKKEQERGVAWAGENLAKLDAERAKMHEQFIDNHLAKLNKRIAKMDESNTWANHVLKNHGPVKWDSEMETVYSNPKDAVENGFPKRLIAGSGDGKGQPIDQIAQIMQNNGELQVPSNRNATDYLIEKLSGGETHDGTHDDNRQALAEERDQIERERNGTPETNAKIVESIKAGRKKSGTNKTVDSDENSSDDSDPKWMVVPKPSESNEVSAPSQNPMAHAAAAMDQLAAAEKAKRPATVSDFGEKIEGARKHTSVSTGGRSGAGAGDDEGETNKVPAWRRKYGIGQDANSGKWFIHHGDNLVTMNGRVAEFNTKEGAEAALPLHALAATHGVHGDSQNKYHIYRRVSDRKMPIVKDGFDTREAAMGYMVRNPEEILNHKFPDWQDYSYLDHVERIGESHHEGDVSTEDFQKAFGFRGGQFGNWQTNKDGQTSLNHAYDALHDLATVTGLSPKDISLNGKLAIAFGARGHGGKHSARAHYEPGKSVINLTKMKGAGSLAHEWFHAIDHAVSKGEFGDKADLLTRGTPYNPKNKEVVDAWKDLVRELTSVEQTNTIDGGKANKQIDKAQEHVNEILKDIDDRVKGEQRWNKRFKPLTPEQAKEWNELQEKMRAGEFGPIEIVGSGYKAYGASENLRKLDAIYKAATGRSLLTMDERSIGNQMRFAVMRVEDAKKRLAQANEGATETKRTRSNYYNEAIALDKTRSSDYYQDAAELAARAFSAYVEDKLAAAGMKSDYLSAKSHNKHYKLIGAKPFPEGAERDNINAKFDKLFSVIRKVDNHALGVRDHNVPILPKGTVGSVDPQAERMFNVVHKQGQS